MTTLTEFLLARIAEDEAAARAVPPLDHNYDMGGRRQDERFTFGRSLPSSADGMGNWSKHRDSPTTRAHFERWHPARILADCEAKRRIVEMWVARADDHPVTTAHRTGLGLAIKALASVYADHPDYNPTWAA